MSDRRAGASAATARVLMYCTAACPYCQAADRLLAQKGVRDVERVRVDLHPERRPEMEQRSGRRTVPQIWIGGRHVGGSDELHDLEHSGQLDQLLAKAT
jgi:glutaredoxin 3